MSAYEAALRNDPVFRAAIKENEASQANFTVGRAALLPQISGSGTQMSNESRITGPYPTLGSPTITTTRAYPSTNAYFQVTQPLFNLAALAQMRQGKAQAAQGEAKFVFSAQDLLVRVLQAYTDVLYAQDNLSYLIAQRDAYQEQLVLNERMFKGGEGTVTDALETSASYEMAVAQVIEAENVVGDAKRRLEALTGDRLNSATEVRGLLKTFKVKSLTPNAFDVWRQMALDNNPEIRASTQAVEVARQEYEKQQAGHYPTLSGVATWGQQSSQNTATINQTALTSAIGVQVSIPLYAGGATVGRAVQAYANYEKAQADRDAAINKISIELNKQYDLVRSSIKRIEALVRAVDSATELTKAMRKSVQGGQRINLDVLLADKGLSVAQRDLAQAKYTYFLANLKLKQQAGVLEIADLELTAQNFMADKTRK